MPHTFCKYTYFCKKKLYYGKENNFAFTLLYFSVINNATLLYKFCHPVNGRLSLTAHVLACRTQFRMLIFKISILYLKKSSYKDFSNVIFFKKAAIILKLILFLLNLHQRVKTKTQ